MHLTDEVPEAGEATCVFQSAGEWAWSPGEDSGTLRALGVSVSYRSPPTAARPRGPDKPGLTSLSRSFSRKWRATWLGRMFLSMFSLCSLSSFISLISSLAWTRHRKSRRAVYSSCGSGDRREGTGSDTRLWEVDKVLRNPPQVKQSPS